jgi:hypothetical protein
MSPEQYFINGKKEIEISFKIITYEACQEIADNQRFEIYFRRNAFLRTTCVFVFMFVCVCVKNYFKHSGSTLR